MYNKDMTVLLGVVYAVLLVCLLIVLGVHPQLSSHSRFALQRRAKGGDKEAKLLLRRHMLLRDLFSLQRVVSAVLLVAISFVGMELFHWLPSFLISLVIALESGAVARLSLWQGFSQRIYERYEAKILLYIEKHPLLFRIIRSVALVPNDAYDLESREELLEIVENSGDVLDTHEKNLIVNGLRFNQVEVGSVMTPESMIDSVSHDEVLGPLVLDDLYKTGHSRFPVIDGDINHIVGILYVQDLLSLKMQKSQTVKSAMDKEVYYIREGKTLDYALAAFLRTKHHLFVVINQFHETVGLLSLEDVMEALLGRKITDEFDRHEDLRKVAEENPHRLNNATAQVKHV